MSETKSLRLIVASIADRDLKRRNLWWKANRREAPLLFATAVREAYAVLKQNPGIGSPYEHRVAGVHRYLLGATQHWLYYMLRDQAPLPSYIAVLGFQGPGEAEAPDLYNASREV